MSWTEGYFPFEEGPPCRPAVEAPVRSPTEALLMEGARRIDEWSRIGSKILHLGVVPRLARRPTAAACSISVPFEWEVLAAVDGERDLRALADVGAIGVRGGPYGLRPHRTGVVELDDPHARAAGRRRDAISRRCWCQARGHGEPGDIAAARWRRCPGAPDDMPEARRLLGVSPGGAIQAGAGDRHSWTRAGPPPSGRGPQAPRRAHATRGGSVGRGNWSASVMADEDAPWAAGGR